MQFSLQILASFNFLVFTGIIWYNREKLNSAIFIFSFFLLGKGLTILSSIGLDSPSIQSNQLLYSGAFILNSFLFFYAPFLYAFTWSIIKENSPAKNLRIHFIPFFIYLILQISLTARIFYPLSSPFLENLIWFRGAFMWLYYLQVVGYTSASLWLMYKSGPGNRKLDGIFKWLKTILAVFILIWLMFLGSSFVYTFFEEPMLSDILTITGLFLLVALSNLTLFIMFRSPEYFYSNLYLKQNNGNGSSLSKAQYQELCDIITSQKLYQNPDLKVGDLASKISLSARNTSRLISTYHGGNFNDFINSYRIEEAKNLLANKGNDMTILTILYESGFNSKSVFNTTFKKIVGKTPSDYRVHHSK